jgi:hypothetical protein
MNHDEAPVPITFCDARLPGPAAAGWLEHHLRQLNAVATLARWVDDFG